MKEKLYAYGNQLRAWATCDANRRKVEALRDEAHRAFTAHPEATGETYLQHLWFTVRMAARFLYTSVVLLTHGIFPFLLTRAASLEIERIYRIMKTRIPKSQRDAIDADYSV